MNAAPGPGITARTPPPPDGYIPAAAAAAEGGMAAARGAAGRGAPGRPCPFSIEHILSGLPERSPQARAARPPPAPDRQSPSEPGEPGAPEAARCACCCCCGPRGPPEADGRLGECTPGARAGWLGGLEAPGARGAQSPSPRLTAPSPRRRAAGVAAAAGTRGALALGRALRGPRGAARRGCSGPAAPHAASPHHL